jgi:hypothetical protein
MKLHIFFLANFCSFCYVAAKSGINAGMAFLVAVMLGVYYGYLLWGDKQ